MVTTYNIEGDDQPDRVRSTTCMQFKEEIQDNGVNFGLGVVGDNALFTMPFVPTALDEVPVRVPTDAVLRKFNTSMASLASKYLNPADSSMFGAASEGDSNYSDYSARETNRETVCTSWRDLRDNVTRYAACQSDPESRTIAAQVRRSELPVCYNYHFIHLMRSWKRRPKILLFPDLPSVFPALHKLLLVLSDLVWRKRCRF